MEKLLKISHTDANVIHVLCMNARLGSKYSLTKELNPVTDLFCPCAMHLKAYVLEARLKDKTSTESLSAICTQS